MSLRSHFYIDDAAKIVVYLRQPGRDPRHSPAVMEADFSGGIARPFLFPEDFGRLVDPGAGQPSAAFEELAEQAEPGDAPDGDEGAAHLLSDAGVRRLAGLSPDELRRFSDRWNAERHAFGDEYFKRNPVWKNRKFWTLYLGLGLGLAGGPAFRHEWGTALMVFASVSAVALAAAVWLEKRRLQRRRRRPVAEVDWVPPLRALQEDLRRGIEAGHRVIYEWSL